MNFSSSAIGSEHHVLVDDDAKRPSGTDGDGGLDVEVALGDALADLISAILGGLADRLDEIVLLVAEQRR